MDGNLYFCIHNTPSNGRAVMNQINRSCPEQNIAAVVVTYNRKKLLEQCIKRILNQPGDEFDVDYNDTTFTAMVKIVDRALG